MQTLKHIGIIALNTFRESIRDKILYNIGLLAIGLALFSIVLGIQTLIRYIMRDSVEGFTTVILLLLLIGGCIMVSLGIIGHYLGRIYEEVKGRPRYIIREMTPDVHVYAKEEK